MAIIGILAAIAIPKFADMINKAKEGATKGGLSAVRSALQIYYSDNEGWFPTGADALTSLTVNAKYIKEIPVAKLPLTGHDGIPDVPSLYTNASLPVTSPPTKKGEDYNTPSDYGGWAYYSDSSDTANWGNFLVNCTHKDVKGTTIWTEF